MADWSLGKKGESEFNNTVRTFGKRIQTSVYCLCITAVVVALMGIGFAVWDRTRFNPTMPVVTVEENPTVRDTLFGKIVSSRQEIDLLLRQLNLPKPDFLQDDIAISLPLIDLEEKVNALRKNLTAEKYDRIRQREILISEDLKYSRRLGYPLFQAHFNCIMSRQELELFKKHVDKARRNWESNFIIFIETQAKINVLSHKVHFDRSILTSFQRFLLSGDSDPNLILSFEHMSEIAALKNMLQQLFNYNWEKIRQPVDALRTELIKWFDLCNVPKSERQLLEFDPAESTLEIIMNKYEKAIAHWSSIYEKQKEEEIKEKEQKTTNEKGFQPKNWWPEWPDFTRLEEIWKNFIHIFKLLSRMINSYYYDR